MIKLGVKTEEWAKTKVTMRSAVKNYPKKVISRLFLMTFHFWAVTSVTRRLHDGYMSKLRN